MALVASSRRHLRLPLLRRLLSSSPPPTAPSSAAAISRFDPAIRRLARAGRLSDIEALLEPRKKEALSSSSSPEPALASLAAAYASAGMLDHALATLSSIPPPNLSPLSLNSLLSALTHHPRLFRQVPDLFADLPRRFSLAPDHISYSILIKSLCLARDARKALPFLKEMEDKNIPLSTVTYTTLIDSLYKERRPAEAERLWNEMAAKGLAPDLPAYNVRVMYRALHGSPSEVLDQIAEMEAAGLKPDAITYNYLIASYCKHGRTEEAMKVYRGFGDKGCAPNTATYKKLLNSICKNGDFDVGLDVFADSMKQGKVPDFGSVKLLVEGLMKGSKVRAAKRVVSGLKKKFPEEFTGVWTKLEKIVAPNADGEGAQQVVAA